MSEKRKKLAAAHGALLAATALLALGYRLVATEAYGDEAANGVIHVYARSPLTEHGLAKTGDAFEPGSQFTARDSGMPKTITTNPGEHMVYEAAPAAWSAGGTTQSPAGQEVIRLSAEDRPLDAGFAEVYRLGSRMGDGWDAFGQVPDLGFDEAGNLYILDRGAVRIYVVDRQGNLVRQFIGEGEGPGEFEEPSALGFGVMTDGRVTVFDPNRMGFALFDANSEFERTTPLPGPHTHYALIFNLQAFRGRDRFLSTTEVGYLSTSEPGPDDDAPAPFRYLLSYDLTVDQVAIDSVVAGWWPAVHPDAAFRPRLMGDVLPSGEIVYTDSSAYAIKFAMPGGPVTRILTRPFEPRPVTERIRAAEIERQLERIGDAGGDPLREAMNEWQRNQIEEMEFYHEMPVLLALRTSWEGTIWVRRRGEEGAGGNPIDLITADGRYLGTFAPGTTGLPRAFGPDGLIAFVETDDLDVPYVVVKRLPAGVR